MQQASKMENRSPANITKTSDDYSQQHETITSSVRISAVLRPVMDRHTVITATLPDCNHFFNTAFLEINPDSGTLVIDELNPKSGHDVFIKSQRITLHAMHEGVEINFTVNLKNAGSEKGIAFYELEFPESIRHLQRRSSFRVPVSGANKIDAEIHTENNDIYSGELSDISSEGMCIRFPKKKAIAFENNSKETQCLIKLPNKQEIKCAFKICHSIVNDTNNSLYIGGHFERLDKIQRRAIERFVIELQRESRKKMTR